MPESRSANIGFKEIKRGLAIFKNGHSRYWHLRLWDPLAKKYVRRSTKETNRLDAISVAVEYAQSFRSPVDKVYAAQKSTSFEYFAKKMNDIDRMSGKRSADDEAKLLNRSKDGILQYFGHWDVSKINTAAVRDYLYELDRNRGRALAQSTKAKHLIIIRKALSRAVEEGALGSLPILPKIKTEDKPRIAFTDQGWERFCKAANQVIANREFVRGVKVTSHHVSLFRFIIFTFLRPTENELFGIKHKDVKSKGNPTHLEIVVNGKTGKRTTVTMPLAVPVYQGTTMPGTRRDPNAYVWMPEYKNRTTAINTARRIFNHILEVADMVDEKQKLTPYSLRHYALQKRMIESGGQVNIYNLAKNAGTSVDQLQRFYLKSMPLTGELIQNLQFRK